MEPFSTPGVKPNTYGALVNSTRMASVEAVRVLMPSPAAACTFSITVMPSAFRITSPTGIEAVTIGTPLRERSSMVVEPLPFNAP